jgi:hypothetical protein
MISLIFVDANELRSAGISLSPSTGKNEAVLEHTGRTPDQIT